MSVIKNLSGPEFRRIVKNRLEDTTTFNEGMVEGDHILNPGYHDALVEKAIKAAAVLIPVVERGDGLNMVFTMRTQKLNSHSGQVSFPGGRIDASDQNAQYAALRETHEEIGVNAGSIEVLGQMPDYYTGSGYHISPIVGLVDGQAEFCANPHEVEYIFEVPLLFLMDPANHMIGSKSFENIERHFYEMPWNEHYIWGVTAGIVRMFYNRVFK